MMVRGDLDKLFVQSKTAGGVRLALFFQNIWKIPMVVAKIEVTLSQWRSVIAIPNLSLHVWLFQFLLDTYNPLAG
jgi:hypothetical protein